MVKKHVKIPFLSARTATATKMTVSDAIAMARSDDVVIVDVRNSAELLASGVAENAIHIALPELSVKANPTHPDLHPQLHIEKTIFIYCASGARSGMAAKALLAMGYTKTHNIGSIRNWAAAGGSVVPFSAS